MVIAETPIQRYAMRIYTGEYLFNVVHFYLEIYAASQRSGEFCCIPPSWMILLKHQLRFAKVDIGKLRLCAPDHNAEAKHIVIEAKGSGKICYGQLGNLRFQ